VPRRKRASKSKKRALTLDEELAFMIGSLPAAFPTPAEARAAWFAHRDHLMADAGEGKRPVGWWAFEAGEPQPRSRGAEAARLAQLGELAEGEIA
jgi:hypothetical protein